jgi:hypothetical protein
MVQVEKNDVNISSLFTWGKHFEIVVKDGVVANVYMRLLGDADINKTRVFSLRKTAELRRKLLDPTSDERIVYIKSIDDMTLDELYGGISLYSMREFTNRANKEVKVKVPKVPKGEATLEETEKYQKEIDDYPEKYYAAIQKYMDKLTDGLIESLKTESKESLYNMYLKLLINEFCEQEAFVAYKNMELYLGCFKDPEYKERLFSSFEEFENMDTQLKIEFRSAYNSLEINMNELKKLREATQ